MKRFKLISGACLALLSVCMDEAMAEIIPEKKMETRIL